MIRVLPLFLALCGAAVSVDAAGAGSSAGESRVILVSFDGAGFDMISRLVARGALPNFSRLIEQGAWSDGMVTSFPTKTAAAHAMLFTGHYGHTSGITGNAVLRLPGSNHTRLETTSGYFAGPLRVEPIWVTTARAGLISYVLHGTQAYPFGDEVELESLFVAHGYTETQLRAEMIRAGGVSKPLPTWQVPEARGSEAREFAFEVGDSRFYGLFFDDPFDPSVGCDTLGVVTAREDDGFAARIKTGVADGFSTPVRASASGKDVWFSLRLFTLAADASDFMLFRSGAVEMAVSTPAFPGYGLPVLRVFAGNAGAGVYERGGLGAPRFRGGDGSAEARLLETEAHLQAQLMAQARLVLREEYRLAVLYSPVSDEIAHTLVGYVMPDLADYDEELAEALWPVVAEGFALQDRFLGELLDQAERDAAHVLVVSDHGMAPTNRLVHLNVALGRAGLLSLTPGRAIDLARTRALALPLSDASVAVNAVDRLGGIVPLDDKAAMLREVRRALEEIVDPETGEPVITAMLEPSTSGLVQPGGLGTGDLFVDFAPGYYPSTSTRGDIVIEAVAPVGSHIFLPTRRAMRAIFGAFGPRIPAGFNFGRARAIDVVPTVLDLLGLEASPSVSLPGRSVVPERGILQPSR